MTMGSHQAFCKRWKFTLVYIAVVVTILLFMSIYGWVR